MPADSSNGFLRIYLQRVVSCLSKARWWSTVPCSGVLLVCVAYLLDLERLYIHIALIRRNAGSMFRCVSPTLHAFSLHVGSILALRLSRRCLLLLVQSEIMVYGVHAYVWVGPLRHCAQRRWAKNRLRFVALHLSC